MDRAGKESATQSDGQILKDLSNLEK